MLFQDLEEGSRGWRKARTSPMGCPQGSIVCESTNWNTREDTAFEFLTDTHSRYERETYSLLHKALDGFDGRELYSDIEGSVLPGKGFDHL